MRLISRTILAILLLIPLTATGASAQSGGTGHLIEQGSAHATAVAGNYLLVPADPLALFDNPATVAATRHPRATFARRQLYSLAEFNLTTAATVARLGPATGGVRIGYFGQSDLYSQLSAELALAADPVPWLSLGASWQHRREEFGGPTPTIWSGSRLTLGAILTIRKQLQLAGCIGGIEVDEMYETVETETAERHLALAYRAAADLALGIRWSKHGDAPQEFSVAQALGLSDRLTILSGLHFDPIRYTVGFIIAADPVAVAYSYVSHPDLGGTHGLSLGFGIGGRGE